jgi:hypothetical protein
MVAKLIRHKFQSAVADGTDATKVRPSNWNGDAHDWRLGGRTYSTAGGTDTIVAADEQSLIRYNCTSTPAVQITGALPSGWMTFIRNVGPATAVVAPISGQINPGSGYVANFILRVGEDAIIISDGTNYDAIVRSGSIFSRAGQIPGITTGTNASVGNVGEYFSNSTAAIGLSPSDTGTSTNLLTLTAGDWDLDGNVTFLVGTPGQESNCYINYVLAWITLGSGLNLTIPGTQTVWVGYGNRPFIYVASIVLPLPTVRLKISSGSATVFIGAQAGYTGNNVRFSCQMTARRNR